MKNDNKNNTDNSKNNENKLPHDEFELIGVDELKKQSPAEQKQQNFEWGKQIELKDVKNITTESRKEFQQNETKQPDINDDNKKLYKTNETREICENEQKLKNSQKSQEPQKNLENKIDENSKGKGKKKIERKEKHSEEIIEKKEKQKTGYYFPGMNDSKDEPLNKKNEKEIYSQNIELKDFDKESESKTADTQTNNVSKESNNNKVTCFFLGSKIMSCKKTSYFPSTKSLRFNSKVISDWIERSLLTGVEEIIGFKDEESLWQQIENEEFVTYNKKSSEYEGHCVFQIKIPEELTKKTMTYKVSNALKIKINKFDLLKNLLKYEVTIKYTPPNIYTFLKKKKLLDSEGYFKCKWQILASVLKIFGSNYGDEYSFNGFNDCNNFNDFNRLTARIIEKILDEQEKFASKDEQNFNKKSCFIAQETFTNIMEHFCKICSMLGGDTKKYRYRRTLFSLFQRWSVPFDLAMTCFLKSPQCELQDIDYKGYIELSFFSDMVDKETVYAIFHFLYQHVAHVDIWHKGMGKILEMILEEKKFDTKELWCDFEKCVNTYEGNDNLNFVDNKLLHYFDEVLFIYDLTIFRKKLCEKDASFVAKAINKFPERYKDIMGLLLQYSSGLSDEFLIHLLSNVTDKQGTCEKMYEFIRMYKLTNGGYGAKNWNVCVTKILRGLFDSNSKKTPEEWLLIFVWDLCTIVKRDEISALLEDYLPEKQIDYLFKIIITLSSYSNAHANQCCCNDIDKTVEIIRKKFVSQLYKYYQENSNENKKCSIENLSDFKDDKHIDVVIAELESLLKSTNNNVVNSKIIFLYFSEFLISGIINNKDLYVCSAKSRIKNSSLYIRSIAFTRKLEKFLKKISVGQIELFTSQIFFRLNYFDFNKNQKISDGSAPRFVGSFLSLVMHILQDDPSVKQKQFIQKFHSEMDVEKKFVSWFTQQIDADVDFLVTLMYVEDYSSCVYRRCIVDIELLKLLEPLLLEIFSKNFSEKRCSCLRELLEFSLDGEKMPQALEIFIDKLIKKISESNDENKCKDVNERLSLCCWKLFQLVVLHGCKEKNIKEIITCVCDELYLLISAFVIESDCKKNIKNFFDLLGYIKELPFYHNFALPYSLALSQLAELLVHKYGFYAIVESIKYIWVSSDSTAYGEAYRGVIKKFLEILPVNFDYGNKQLFLKSYSKSNDGVNKGELSNLNIEVIHVFSLLSQDTCFYFFTKIFAKKEMRTKEMRTKEMQEFFLKLNSSCGEYLSSINFLDETSLEKSNTFEHEKYLRSFEIFVKQQEDSGDDKYLRNEKIKYFLRNLPKNNFLAEKCVKDIEFFKSIFKVGCKFLASIDIFKAIFNTSQKKELLRKACFPKESNNIGENNLNDNDFLVNLLIFISKHEDHICSSRCGTTNDDKRVINRAAVASAVVFLARFFKREELQSQILERLPKRISDEKCSDLKVTVMKNTRKIFDFQEGDNQKGNNNVPPSTKFTQKYLISFSVFWPNPSEVANTIIDGMQPKK